MLCPVISLGSPYGIGYEVFLLSISKIKKYDKPLFCIGSKKVLDYFIDLLNFSCHYKSYNSIRKEKFHYVDSYDFILIDIDQQLQDQNWNLKSIALIDSELDGEIAYKTLKYGAELIKQGFFSSLVTLPVSKENINLIDHDFKGHTEFLMKEWEQKKVYMTFISEKLRILLLSTHIPLAEVPRVINPELVKDSILTAGQLLKRLNNNQGICFLGLNPHAGENGLLGKEEIWIKKIIAELREKNKINVIGPVPADTAFTPANINKFGIYISSYHDQGLIPFKMLAFDDGVNLSFGMEFIRTSVDHGTARDLIGKKIASTISFENAYNLAVKLTCNHS